MPEPEHPPVETPPLHDGGWDFGLFHPMVFLSNPALLLHNPLALVTGGFWAWMLVHCIRHDPERYIWLWVLFVLNVPGAVIYFVARWLPGARVSGGPSVFARLSRRRQIPRLEAAARQIGNPHQFIELGDALRDVGRYDRAAQSYQRALDKEPTNLAALWGAAQAAMSQKKFAEAKTFLATLIGIDIAYKFGDVSLAYGRTLFALGEKDAAREHFSQHLRRWPNPEARVLFATLLTSAGDTAAARDQLEGLLLDMHGVPSYYLRQNRTWVRKAKQLLKRLPREVSPPS